MEPGLSSLLEWSVKNSEGGRQGQNGAPVQEPNGMSADALRALMGGPSDADLMREAMTIIISTDPEVTLDSKKTAFDNFEQLVENIDNANNMEPLGLWTPLISQLGSPEPDLRRMAAWSIGTAVQNNVKAQERFLALDGVPKLCKLTLEDGNQDVRRKAVYALSSEIRNYQPAMNEAVKSLPKDIVGPDEISSTDMDVIDAIMGKLRER